MVRKVGSIGDRNPIEYGGGPVYQDDRDGSAWVEYTHGIESDAPDWQEGDEPEPLLQVYSVPLESSFNELIRQYAWIEWPEVARSVGAKTLDDLCRDDYGEVLPDTPQNRAMLIWTAAGYYGWHEFDSYPLEMTPSDLANRW